MSSDTIELPKEIVDVIRRDSQRLLDYDDRIKELQAEIKKYREAKARKEAMLLQVLDSLDFKMPPIEVVASDTGDMRGKLTKAKSTTKAPVNMSIVKKVMMEVYKDERKAEEMVKKIHNARPVKEKYYIKRTNKRPRKQSA